MRRSQGLSDLQGKVRRLYSSHLCSSSTHIAQLVKTAFRVSGDAFKVVIRPQIPPLTKSGTQQTSASRADVGLHPRLG